MANKLMSPNAGEHRGNLDAHKTDSFMNSGQTSCGEFLPSRNVPICMISDEEYLLPTMVTIKSLFLNAHAETEYRLIVIVTKSVPRQAIELLKGLSTARRSIEVIEAPDISALKSLCVPEDSHVSRAALYKFALADILTNYKRALYIDSDLIIQRDLSDLLGISFHNNYAAVVESFSAALYVPKLNEKLSITHYFNSGVMLLNLERMRAEGISSCLIDYRLHGWSYFVDQDAFNAVFCDEIICLPPYFNLQASAFNYFSAKQMCRLYRIPMVYSWNDLCNEAYIVHFCSSIKPWKYSCAWRADLWVQYYSQLPENVKEQFPLKRKRYPQLGLQQVKVLKKRIQSKVKQLFS